MRKFKCLVCCFSWTLKCWSTDIDDFSIWSTGINDFRFTRVLIIIFFVSYNFSLVLCICGSNFEMLDIFINIHFIGLKSHTCLRPTVVHNR